MGRRLGTEGFVGYRLPTPRHEEIALYGANLGRVRGDASSLRRALQMPVPLRTWHRVFPYLPQETLPDGALVIWHPDADGWRSALEAVHQLRAPIWRRSGAYVSMPGSGLVGLHDFHDLDDIDLPDWSIAMPDADFADRVRRMNLQPCRLSELAARWALEVGPQRAGVALSLQRMSARDNRH